jgi:hypothetical protein
MKKSLLALAAGLLTAGAVHAAPVQWAVNGHYYEFIDTNLTWGDAAAAAAGMSYLGMTGYLATAVDAAENRFISSDIGGGTLGWLGASDEGNEGNWTWRTGPESGQALSFFNWNAGEPNNCCGGENFLQTNWGSVGLWNDHGGPGNAGQVNGFFVEYGAAAVPEPETLALVTLGLLAMGLSRRRPR